MFLQALKAISNFGSSGMLLDALIAAAGTFSSTASSRGRISTQSSELQAGDTAFFVLYVLSSWQRWCVSAGTLPVAGHQVVTVGS
jgi:hypothetical protein